MAKKRVHVWISGRVQGVFFRAYTKDAALQFGVNGWVRNLPDGRVEAVFEGDEEAVDGVVQWCHKGSPLSRVDHVEVVEEPYQNEFTHFDIRHWR
ncbi:acylphosphatase [Desulfacinum hydrothermale DSM 13146]|uniref:Acylphosphatase n=1 Tax=Desulfacinum hydrothermale DSM 13146 TaxID=1121390 RepID=A0A1W1XFV4_9BACT|nr:acylphosphatase [Desulfacinum hydrothermale]SMC22381.1 acylphosphatase [Desulfacinum hydrothermale DSM 13146]